MNLRNYFKYELTQEPSSLFIDRFVQESHKSDLKNILIENANNVVDGGALFYQVPWNKNSSYSEVIDQLYLVTK